MITSIDHIVMTAADPDATIAFYCDVLGMELQSFQPQAGRQTQQEPSCFRQQVLCSCESPMWRSIRSTSSICLAS